MNMYITIGRLTKEPEIKEAVVNGQSTTVGKFSLAVPNSYKNKDGEVVTTFINNLTVMGQKVKVLESLHKGRLILVVSHLTNNDYTDKN